VTSRAEWMSVRLVDTMPFVEFFCRVLRITRCLVVRSMLLNIVVSRSEGCALEPFASMIDP
jgi:hypothetical protein